MIKLLLRTLLASVLLLYAAPSAQPADSVYPGPTWRKANPSGFGWSAAKVEAARQVFSTYPPASLVIVDHGRIVVEWGDPAKRVKVSSLRKSLLSALCGIAVAEGKLQLDNTLAELGIDDTPPISETEKQATVRMLLQARSGVYHGFVSGTPSMLADPREALIRLAHSGITTTGTSMS